MSKRSSALARAEEALREHGLALPEAYEEFPWGERALKVAKKVFVFMRCEPETRLSLSVKLGDGAEAALQLPFVESTGYGLGRAGWVTATFGPGDAPPVGILCDWIDDSYAHVAPKKLLARTQRQPKAR